jgi:CHAD domain-containing protein
MGYVFKQEQSIAQNINRILSEEVKAAIDTLESPGDSPAEAIHGVRKRIKKIRALFRLVRSELKGQDFKRENTYYRLIGNQLSTLRDATVMINTAEKLRETYPDTISPKVFTTLRKALVQQQAGANRDFFDDPDKIREVADAFRQARLKVAGLPKHHNGFWMMAPNLKGIYRRARKGLKVVIQDPTIHHLHEFRKEVKTLWYHTRLLQPIWPDLFRAYGQELGRLGELLGDDHDVGVLAQAIESDQFRLGNKQTKATVVQLLHEHRTQLQKQILPLANRLLVEKAGDFVGRYRRYWKLWQAEAKQQTAVHNLQAA